MNPIYRSHLSALWKREKDGEGEDEGLLHVGARREKWESLIHQSLNRGSVEEVFDVFELSK